MIPRYTHPEMGRIWSDQRRYETWLLVETAAAEAMAAAGIVPAEAARDIRERGGFDIARIEEIEQITQHDVIAFTTAVAEKVGPSARWLHFGMTSSDVIDTAQALQMREACDLILSDLDALAEAIRDRAFEHRRTPMIGRTHGVHAEPMTFGLKLALWYAEVARDVERVRARAHGRSASASCRAPSARSRTCRRASRPTSAGASGSSRRRSPRRSSSAIATPSCWRRSPSPARRSRSSRSKSAACRRPKSARSRSRSPRARRAPRRCRTSATRSAASRSSAWRGCFAATATRRFENIALWHERDISHSSVERVILPDSFIALDHMLRRFTRIVRGMVVYADRMRENLERSRGVVFSGTVLLELAKEGRLARSRRTNGCSATRCGRSTSSATSRRCCWPIADVTRRAVRRAEIERAFDLDEQLQHVDQIFDRVFHAGRGR